MEPNQQSPQPTQEPEETPLYPTATKGTLSDDHSSYGKQGTWKGVNPDKNMRLYFFGFIILIGILFAFAVMAWTGRPF